jgi:hypothetical protein
VKADQLDDSSVWQELDEFVITRELDQHFCKFISWYLEAVDQEKNPDPTGKTGIWISGFFDSGKSHFLKVLSYLLNNRTHTNNGQSKQAVEFFESKVKDAMLFADIKRAVVANTDVVLFNIDSKVGHGTRFGRLDWVDIAFDAVLSTKVQTLVAPLQSVTVESLEQKLGGIGSIAELRTKLLTLYAPSVVDAIFVKLRISTLDDFERQRHLFIEFVGAVPPAFDPNDLATRRDYTVSLRVKIADGFDVAGALQSAKLCGSILEHEAIPDSPAGVERIKPYALVTLFADSAVTDTSLPGQTAAQAKTAVKALFIAERMFAQFIT